MIPGGKQQEAKQESSVSSQTTLDKRKVSTEDEIDSSMIAGGKQHDQEGSFLSQPVLHATAGICSRCACETIVSPLNLVKTRLQYSPQLRQPSLVRTFGSIVREEGVIGCFRGLPPRLLWAAPLASVSFIYYEELKRLMTTIKQKSGLNKAGDQINLPLLFAGPPVLALGVMARTPFDIVEMRLQLLGQTKQPGTTKTVFRDVYATQGLRGLLRGFSGAFVTISTFLASYFLIYEQTRRFVLESEMSVSRTYEPIVHVGAGVIAGACGAVLSNPLDVIKTRMQTQAGSATNGGKMATNGGSTTATLEVTFPSMRSVFRQTVSEGGYQALWSGLTPRLLQLSFAGAIIFSSYEASKRFLIYLTPSKRGVDGMSDGDRRRESSR